MNAFIIFGALHSLGMMLHVVPETASLLIIEALYLADLLPEPLCSF